MRKTVVNFCKSLLSSSVSREFCSSFPAVVVQIDEVSELSYALLRQPSYTSWFVMTDHKASSPGLDSYIPQVA